MSPGLADILFVQPQASAAVRIKQNGLTVLCPRAGIVCRLVQRQSLRRLHAGSVGGADIACPAMSANNLPDMPMSEMSAHPPDIDLRGTSKLCPSFIRSGTLMRMWRAGCVPSSMSAATERQKVAPGSRGAGAGGVGARHGQVQNRKAAGFPHSRRHSRGAETVASRPLLTRSQRS